MCTSESMAVSGQVPMAAPMVCTRRGRLLCSLPTSVVLAHAAVDVLASRRAPWDGCCCVLWLGAWQCTLASSMAAAFLVAALALVGGSAQRESMGVPRIVHREAVLHFVHCSPAPGLMQPNAQPAASRPSAFVTRGFSMCWRVDWPPAERRIRPR